jgi:DNA-binding MarR family transcriptional regulator
MTLTPDQQAPAPVADASLDAFERALRIAAKRLFSVRPVTASAIDRSGYIVLGTLVAAGELRLSDVAAQLELDPSTVSRQVRQLDAAGLVTRREDPADGRATLLAATAAGERLHLTVRRLRLDLLEAALDGWSTAERADLVRLVERLADNLHTMGSSR